MNKKPENTGLKKNIVVIDTVIKNGKYVNASSPKAKICAIGAAIVAALSTAAGTIMSLFL